MRNIREKFAKGAFAASLKRIRDSPENSLMILAFDLFFFLSVGIFLKLVNVAVPLQSPGVEALLRGFWGPLVALLYNIGYFFAIIALYSFFKLLILHKIKNYFIPAKAPSKQFWGFFRMNVMFFVAFASLSLGIAFFTKSSLEPGAVKPATMLLTGILALFSYLYASLSHSAYLQHGFLGSLKTANSLFWNSKSYRPLAFLLSMLAVYS